MSDVVNPVEPAALPSRVTPPPVRKPGRPKHSTNPYPIGLTTKVEAALNKIVFDGMTRPEAAKAVGLADTSLRLAFRNPVVLKAYRQMVDVLRTSEQPRSITKIASLRDAAKSERVQLEAAKHLDGGDKNAGVTVNVGVGVNVQPGYQVSIPGEYADAGRQMLKLAGSTRNVADMSHDVPTDGQGTPE